MNKTTLALLAAATAASPLALPAAAHADTGRVMFESPSGSIRCVLDVSSRTDAPMALCQIKDYTYVVPTGLARDEATGQPCRGTGQSGDFRLDQGQPGFLRCSYAALAGGVGPWPTLEYGQRTSSGAITCESAPTGITCTDTDSGHFFRVSRESYQLG